MPRNISVRLLIRVTSSSAQIVADALYFSFSYIVQFLCMFLVTFRIAVVVVVVFLIAAFGFCSVVYVSSNHTHCGVTLVL